MQLWQEKNSKTLFFYITQRGITPQTQVCQGLYFLCEICELCNLKINYYYLRLTLSDHSMSKIRSLRFARLVCVKGVELGHISLLNSKRRTLMDSPTVSFRFAIELPGRVKFSVTHTLNPYVSERNGVRTFITIAH